MNKKYIFCFSILCLKALNKIDEASTLITQLIEQYPQNADLLIIRARLYYKDKNKVYIKIYFSLFFCLQRNKNMNFFDSCFNNLCKM